jgi:hypothetical protein
MARGALGVAFADVANTVSGQLGGATTFGKRGLPVKPSITCLLVLFLVNTTLAATRVALVTAGPGEPVKQASSLAMADLSAEKDLQLVDREAINSTLAEQKLSLSGMVDSEKMIAVGRLLKADLFAVVEADPKDGTALGVVVFDSGTGLRLADVAIHGTPEAAAKEIADAVRTAAAKDRALSHGVRLVGFLPVRNADLPRDRDIFCDTVRLLLERQLTSSPGLAVLERSRLEKVNQERQLPTSNGTGDLWNSVVTVQIQISREGERGLKASATLTGSSGPLDKIVATTDTESAADLADKLRDGLTKSLQAQPIARPFDRNDEARRFARESELFVNSTRYSTGAAAGEAAYALQPDEENRLILATALWMRACEYLTPANVGILALQSAGFDPIKVPSETLDEAVALESRAISLEQQSLDELLRANHDGQDYLSYTGGEHRITLLEGSLGRLGAVRNVDQTLQPRVAEVRAAAMKYIFSYFDGWSEAAGRDPGQLKNYDAEVLYGTIGIANISASLAEFAEARDRLFHRWIETFDVSWTRTDDLWMLSGKRQSTLMKTLFDLGTIPSDSWKDRNAEAWRKGLGNIAADLDHSSSPVMRMYGTIARTLANPKSSAASPQARDQAIQAVFAQLEKTLNNPGEHPQATRLYACIAAADAIHLLPGGTKSSTDLAIDLLNISIGRKQLIPQTVMELLREDSAFTALPDQPQKVLDALRRMLAFSARADVEVVDGNRDGLRQELSDEIHQLHKQFPDLGAEPVDKPWDAVRKLVDVRQLSGISRIEEFAQVAGDKVCFLGSGTDDHGAFFIQAFEVPLAGGVPKPLAKTTVEPLPPFDGNVFHTDLGFVYRLIQGGTVDDRNYYVCVHGEGVVVFPRDGSAAFRLDTVHGLPSNWARCAVAMGGVLYIAMSEEAGAYLAKWDPANRSIDIKMSTVRSEKKSPLDNLPGIRLHFMVADRAHNRLLLGVEEYGNRSRNWDDAMGGLWQMDGGGGGMTHLLRTASDFGIGLFRGIDHGSLFTATTVCVIQTDLKTSQGRFVSISPAERTRDFIRDFGPGKETREGTGWDEPGTQQPGGRTVIDNWLWLGEPFSRISADGTTTQLLDAQLAPDSKPIGPVWTMERAGTNQLVLGDIRQLYVVKLRETNDSLVTSKKAMPLRKSPPRDGHPVVNLVDLVDPPRDVVNGKWEVANGALVCTGSGCIIQFLYQPPEEYDFRIVFTRTKHGDCVNQNCWEHGRQFMWMLNGYGSTTSGFELVNGKGDNPTNKVTPPHQLLQDNQEYTSIVKVRKTGVEAYLNGKLISEWKTDYSDLSPFSGWGLARNGVVGLGSNGTTTFRTVEVIEITGNGKLLTEGEIGEK